MLTIKFDLLDFEEVEIIPISDVHVGNPLSDIQTLHDTISYINAEPDNPKRARICLLNGDLTESITRNSVGNIYEQTMSPQVQVATMIQMLKPLSEPREHYPLGKILSYCGGNHDTDRYKDTGITASESIAVGLGLEERYSAEGCYSFIRLHRSHDNSGHIVIGTVYNQHMTGSGTTAGGRANRIERLGSSVYANLIVGSHFHQPMTFKEDYILPFNQTCSLVQSTITYCITNAFLRYGSYAQKTGLRPSSIKVPRIFLTQERMKDAKGTRYINVEVLL